MNIRRLRNIWGVLPVIFLILSACSSVDCPMNNTVLTVYQLHKANGVVDTLKDSLSVISFQHTPERDPVLLNKQANCSEFYLQVSYQHPQDSLFFVFQQAEEVDTVVIQKENRSHFESVNCNPSFFHTITQVDYTKHMIDSIVIKNREVTYDRSKAHFYIYLRADR